MKFFFFIALLVNIIFFLWEFNSGGLNSSLELAAVDSYKIKQILLVSELANQNGGNSLKFADNNFDLYEQFVSLEFNSEINSKTQEDTEESSKQLIKSSATSIKKFLENLISSDEQLHNEQNTLQHDAAVIVTIDQVGSKESSKQIIKSNNTAIEEFPENLISSKEQLQNDQSEQNTLQQDTVVIATNDQVNSVVVIPVLEEKPLTGERHEEAIVNSLLKSDESNAEQADPDNNYCYHVGPFANHDGLNVWGKLNGIDEDSVSRFNKESDFVTSYLVYLPAADTSAQSRKNVQRLKQKGITDYWLFRRGELKGAISLGLFAKKKGALAMQEKLVQAGFAIKIKERYKKERLLYAEISTKDKAFKDIAIISDKQSVSICENNAH